MSAAKAHQDGKCKGLNGCFYCERDGLPSSHPTYVKPPQTEAERRYELRAGKSLSFLTTILGKVGWPTDSKDS